MRLTRKNADKLAELLIKNPKTTFKVVSDGVIYGVREDGVSKGVIRLGKFKSKVVPIEEELVLWEFNHEEMLGGSYGEKFKYKTHLSDYLYGIVSQVCFILRGRDVKPSGIKQIDRHLAEEYHWEHRAMERDELEQVAIGKYKIKVKGSDGDVYVSIDKKIGAEKVLLRSMYNRYKGKVESMPERTNVEEVGIWGYIDNNYDKYVEEYKIYEEKFIRLGRVWDWKVKEDGLYFGVEHDEVLFELRKMREELEQYYKNTEVLKNIIDIKEYINKNTEMLEDMDRRVGVYGMLGEVNVKL